MTAGESKEIELSKLMRICQALYDKWPNEALKPKSIQNKATECIVEGNHPEARVDIAKFISGVRD